MMATDQEWLDAGLGVKTDAEAGAAFGVTRQAAHQIRKRLGIAAGRSRRTAANHEHVARMIAKAGKCHTVAELARATGVSAGTLKAVERERGLCLSRQQGRPRRWTREILLPAIRATHSLAMAARALGLRSTELNTAINRCGLRGLVNIIMLTRDGYRPRLELQRRA